MFTNDDFFIPNDRILRCLNIPQNSPNSEYTSHLPKNFIIYLISTTKWRYNRGKCILAYNSHILCCTFKNLISTHLLNCAESRGTGHAHLRLMFFPCLCEIPQTYFFKLLPGDFTDFHATLHTASVDSPDKKL